MTSLPSKRNPSRSTRNKRDFTYSYVQPEELSSDDEELVGMPVVRNATRTINQIPQCSATTATGAYGVNKLHDEHSERTDASHPTLREQSCAARAGVRNADGGLAAGRSISAFQALRRRYTYQSTTAVPARRNEEEFLRSLPTSKRAQPAQASGVATGGSFTPARATSRAASPAPAAPSTTCIHCTADKNVSINMHITTHNVKRESSEEYIPAKPRSNGSRTKRKRSPRPRALTPAKRFASLFRVNFTLPNSEEDAQAFLSHVNELKTWCGETLHARCEATRAYIRSLHKGASQDNPFEISDDDMADVETIGSASSCSEVSTARSSPFERQERQEPVEAQRAFRSASGTSSASERSGAGTT